MPLYFNKERTAEELERNGEKRRELETAVGLDR